MKGGDNESRVKTRSSVGWDFVPLGSIATFINGRAYSQSELLQAGKYKVLRVGNFFTNSDWYYSDLELDSDKYVFEGDLMYAWSASFGPRFWSGPKAIYHYHIWKIVPSSKVTKEYLYYYLITDTDKIDARRQGGTMFHITKGDMERRKLLLPAIDEQRRITAVIDAWDKAIALCEQLIIKNRRLRQGLMQQLLTGRVRFKEFNSKWVNRKLCELGTVTGGGTPDTRKEVFWNGDIAWCTPSDVTAINGRKYLNQTGRTLTQTGLANSSAVLLPVNSIVVCTRATIGDVAITGVPMATSQGFKSIVPSGVDVEFLYYCLLSKKRDLKKLGNGSTFFEVSKTDFENLQLMIPPSVEEQRKIAMTLASIDEALDHYRVIVDDLTLQKRTIMSDLLSGKVKTADGASGRILC